MTPPEEPAVDYGRRHFARSLLGLLGMLQEELRGLERMSLGDLSQVPDEVLAEMVPVFREGEPLEVREDGLYRLEDQGSERLLAVFTPLEKQMVDQYGCGRNLQAIARETAHANGLSLEAAFAATKTLFVRLSQEGWCHPAEAHLPPERGSDDRD